MTILLLIILTMNSGCKNKKYDPTGNWILSEWSQVSVIRTMSDLEFSAGSTVKLFGLGEPWENGVITGSYIISGDSITFSFIGAENSEWLGYDFVQRFNGEMVSDDEMSGTYEIFEDNAMVSEGNWSAIRD